MQGSFFSFFRSDPNTTLNVNEMTSVLNVCRCVLPPNTNDSSCQHELVHLIFKAPSASNQSGKLHSSYDMWLCKRLKVSTFIPLHEHDQQRFQFEVAYWPAMTLGGAAQVAAAHCLNERTLDFGTMVNTQQPLLQPITVNTYFVFHTFYGNTYHLQKFSLSWPYTS